MIITDKTELLALYEAISFYTHIREAQGLKYSIIFSDLKIKLMEGLNDGHSINSK